MFICVYMHLYTATIETEINLYILLLHSLEWLF